jgi:hypothetical protein
MDGHLECHIRVQIGLKNNQDKSGSGCRGRNNATSNARALARHGQMHDAGTVRKTIVGPVREVAKFVNVYALPRNQGPFTNGSGGVFQDLVWCTEPGIR